MEAFSVIDIDQVEDEDWESGIFTSSKQTIPRSPFDCNLGGELEEEEEEDDDDDDYDDHDEEGFIDGNYDGKVELGCPYCVEHFDILGLCCHIDDQHYKDAKSGICPICDKTLATNMTVHIITEHESMLRALRREVKVRSGGTGMGLSRLKTEDRFGSHLKAPPPVGSSELSPDPLFLSFIRTPMPEYKPEILRPKPPSEAAASRKTSNSDTVERSIELSSLIDKSRDKVQVCEFVSDLLFSTIFNDL